MDKHDRPNVAWPGSGGSLALDGRPHLDLLAVTDKFAAVYDRYLVDTAAQAAFRYRPRRQAAVSGAGRLPFLLAVALERIGEVAPLMVACDQAIRQIAPATLSPAFLGMPFEVQIKVVRATAAWMRWSARPLADRLGMIAGGVVGGVEV